jgi:hypothetical protein
LTQLEEILYLNLFLYSDIDEDGIGDACDPVS